ncbi:hypothetical protein H5410_044287 [Solanum commersonii]|uniref:Ribulose bisphosphate carboxylase/oxygenase activase AAA helical domain-containing protein n=1 Tax=Solanum commersonii TaxID=4109 RepID=A0A9J5X8N2_SOLCO|nr:hypothetical protein H5410_044287 [Solanum commersonii]
MATSVSTIGAVNKLSLNNSVVGTSVPPTAFFGSNGTGTHHAIMNSYEYLSQGLRQYNLDNKLDGFYIAPAFMDKLVVHITKNFLTLPNIKVPLILGIWGGKGQGKSFQCELVFRNMGIKKGNMCCLFINDLDAGAGRTTKYTVNNQMVNATLMNIADNLTNVQLPGMYNKQENARVPIIVTGNDFSTLYAEDRIGVCKGIFTTDKVPDDDIVKIVASFLGQSIDFFGALRARVYDDEVRKWIGSTGIEQIGEKLLNSRDEPPKMTIIWRGQMRAMNCKSGRLSQIHMATSVSTIGAVNKLSLNNSVVGTSVPPTAFFGSNGTGTHHAIMNSYEYPSQGLRQYNLDNKLDGFYIAAAFIDKLVVHITKNFLTLPNIKVPLILGIWGGNGQGKSFQCELVFRNMGIKKGNMCCLFINDLDAGAGRTTKYTVNNQMVNATLMNIADNLTNVQLPECLLLSLVTISPHCMRDGRMEKFYWAPIREDRIGVCKGIFTTDKVPVDDIVKIVDSFLGQSIEKLLNSRDEPPKMTIDKLLKYGNMLVQEQENVKRVQLAGKYLKEAALGDANADSINNSS